MKKCPCCQKELPESAFWKKNAAKDGLQPYCKVCKKKKENERIVRNMNEEMLFGRFIFGGISATILNYQKKTEKKFNIIDHNTGNSFATNDMEAFFVKLENLLKREW